MIYILEDDDSIRKLVSYALESQGYTVLGFAEPAGLREALNREVPDVLLLDIMLPEEDGISILKKLRADPRTSRLPVIMLTAKSAEYDRVEGLDAGADDYVTKPFGMMELLARVRALLRRTAAAGDAASDSAEEKSASQLRDFKQPGAAGMTDSRLSGFEKTEAELRTTSDIIPGKQSAASAAEPFSGEEVYPPSVLTASVPASSVSGNRKRAELLQNRASELSPGRASDLLQKRIGREREMFPKGSVELRFGKLRIFPEKYEVFVDGRPVTLTRKEYRLLLLLAQNEGNVLTREILMDRIWDLGSEPENRTLDVHIRKVRAKLDTEGGRIETVRGVGYRFRGPADA